MKHTYVPKGVCSTSIDFELDGSKIKGLKFRGGCDGNLKAIAALVEGMDAREAAQKIKGIKCGIKKTSCSDQLSKALLEALESEK